MKTCTIYITFVTDVIDIMHVFTEVAHSGGSQFRVLARISKRPVQNSNPKISARPDLASYIFYILITTTSNSILCQKVHFTLQLCPRTPKKSTLKIHYRKFCLGFQGTACPKGM